MQSVFIKIWVLVLLLMTGCTSVTSTEQLSHANVTVCKGESCSAHGRDVIRRSPLSRPEQSGYRSAAFPTWQIVQLRGEPNQFILCTECPCPTQKSLVSKSAASAAVTAKKWTVYFDNGGYALSEEHKELLTRLYQALPEQHQISVTGYTDDSAPGGTISNQALALLRAQAVAGFLAELGLEMNTVSLQAKPLCCYVAPNSDESGRALNRRTEIILSVLSTRGTQP